MAKKMVFEDIFNLKNHLEEPEKVQTDSGLESDNESIQDISINKLIAFDGQPFRPYPMEKLQELAEDIKDNGILSPIIVRPYVGRYQILAGHNRTNAAKLAGLDTVPCIVKDVDDNTAKLIVVNTNLNQREELLPSEKAFAYKMQKEAILESGATNGRTTAELESETGENKRQIQRYIRLTYLIQPLLDMTDEKALPFRVAVNLSYLKENEQALVNEYIVAHKKSISLDQSEILKMLSKKNDINYTSIAEAFTPLQPEKKAIKKKAIKISYKKLSEYIKPEMPEKEAEEYILKALEFYEKHKTSQTE